jgi:general secretion pathway protein A
MYEKFFGFRANPFSVSPDPRFLYLTRRTYEALACLTYGIQARKGFVLLTGEVGTGKTTLLNKLMDWLRVQRVATAFVFNPRLEPTQFLEFAMADFGIPVEPGASKGALLLKLNHWLLERYRARETAVLVVDEAQNLSLELLEEIRLLTNLETSTEKLLQIVLCGQPELEAKLQQPELRQLRQRITLRCHTYQLTEEDTSNYIARRIQVGGGNGARLFTPEAVHRIYQYSGGIPRLVNLLCEHALIGCFADSVRTVNAGMIDDVAREFELEAAPAPNGEPSPAAVASAVRGAAEPETRKEEQKIS